MSLSTGLCAGCARTLEEIATWSSMDSAQKQAVLALVAQRRVGASSSGAQATEPHATSTRL